MTKRVGTPESGSTLECFATPEAESPRLLQMSRPFGQVGAVRGIERESQDGEIEKSRTVLGFSEGSLLFFETLRSCPLGRPLSPIRSYPETRRNRLGRRA